MEWAEEIVMLPFPSFFSLLLPRNSEGLRNLGEQCGVWHRGSTTWRGNWQKSPHHTQAWSPVHTIGHTPLMFPFHCISPRLRIPHHFWELPKRLELFLFGGRLGNGARERIGTLLCLQKFTFNLVLWANLDISHYSRSWSGLLWWMYVPVRSERNWTVFHFQCKSISI